MDHGQRLANVEAQSWNSGAQRIKGYSQSEIVGKHIRTFYTDEDRAAGVPQLALKTAATAGKFEAEGWRVRKDGSKFWASVVIDAIRDEHGELIGFAKVTRDITERHEAQTLLRTTQEQLATAQKMEAVGQLSGGIAHDFNNLLMIVIGNLETAQHQAPKSRPNPAMTRALANAMRGAQRAAALTSGCSRSPGGSRSIQSRSTSTNSSPARPTSSSARSARTSKSRPSARPLFGMSRSIPTSWNLRWSTLPSMRATPCPTAAS